MSTTFDPLQTAALIFASIVFALLIGVAFLFIAFAAKLLYSKQYQKSCEIMQTWKNKKTWDENQYLVEMGKVKINSNNAGVVFLCVNKEAQVLYVTMELIEAGVIMVKKDGVAYVISCSAAMSGNAFHKKIHAFGSKELMKFGISVLASRSNVNCNTVETFETGEDKEKFLSHVNRGSVFQ